MGETVDPRSTTIERQPSNDEPAHSRRCGRLTDPSRTGTPIVMSMTQEVDTGYSGPGVLGRSHLRACRGQALRHAPVLVLLLAYTLVVMLTFRDYGITWDEPWYATYGERVIEWYQSGFTDVESLQQPIMAPNAVDPNLGNMSYAGGFFDTVAQSAWRLSPFGKFETRHLVNAFFGVAGVAAAYAMALSLAGPLAGFLAALFLVLTPFYYGHSFNNPKDIPFAVLYLVSLYGIVRLLQTFPAPPWRIVVFLGVAIGLTMAVRVGGVLLLGYTVIAFVAGAWRVRLSGAALSLRRLGERLMAIVGLSYGVMVALWPAAQLHPLTHPLKTLLAFSAYPWPYLVRFDGREIPAPDLPRYYLSKYALLTLPEHVLLGLALAAALAIIAIVRRRIPLDGTTLAYGLVLFAILFPLGYAAVTHATVYDGLRHFLFVFPPLVVLSAIGVAQVLRGHRGLALVTAGLVTISAGFTLREMVLLHPHQYIYFNRLVAGGLERAQASYETDYWGNSLKEATEWVVAHYQGDREDPLRVAACGNRMSTAYYLPRSGFRFVLPDSAPDLLLGLRRWHCWDQLNGAVVHTIERRGVALSVVKEVSARAKTRRIATLTPPPESPPLP